MTSNTSKAAVLFYVAGGVAAIVAGLYFARPVLIPFTVSVLLTFLLTPVVSGLERLRFPRALAVLVVAIGAFLLLGGLGYMVGRQVAGIAQDLPRYQQNIRERVRSIQQQTPPVMQRLYRSFMELREAAESPQPKGQRGAPSDDAAGQRAGNGEEPVAVQVEEPNPVLDALRSYLVPALSPVATLGLVIVFTFFMLFQPPDLGYRLTRLVGARRMELTTQMLDEVGRRIARYLLMQLLINSIYGVAVAIPLWLLGLPGALLWGLLCTLLRFIPYVGPWIGAAMPIALSFAAFPGWSRPFAVIGMFLVLELITNNLLEPWLYGTTTGLSPVAVLIAMVFWGWLWGGVGILLAIPMTVCLVVAGKYIPALRLFPVMLGDQNTISPRALFHQYLTTGQRIEALQMAHNHAMGRGWEAMYDDLWGPALAMIQQERQHGWIDRQQSRDALEACSEIVQQLGPWQREALAMGHPRREFGGSTIRCLPPGEDPADRLVTETLANLLRDLGYADAVAVTEKSQLGAIGWDPQSVTLIPALTARSFGRAVALDRELAGRPTYIVVPPESSLKRQRLFWRWWRSYRPSIAYGFREAIRAVRASIFPERPKDAAALLTEARRRGKRGRHGRR